MDPLLYSSYSLLLAATQYLLPLAAISFAYVKTIRRLWGSKAPGNAEEARDALLHRNKKKVGCLRATCVPAVSVPLLSYAVDTRPVNKV